MIVHPQTYEMQVRVPPTMTRAAVESDAREKFYRDLRARGIEPDPKSFEVSWLSDQFGIASINGFARRP
jgi:hypothetical protein